MRAFSLFLSLSFSFFWSSSIYRSPTYVWFSRGSLAILVDAYYTTIVSAARLLPLHNRQFFHISISRYTYVIFILFQLSILPCAIKIRRIFRFTLLGRESIIYLKNRHQQVVHPRCRFPVGWGGTREKRVSFDDDWPPSSRPVKLITWSWSQRNVARKTNTRVLNKIPRLDLDPPTTVVPKYIIKKC